MDRGNIRLESLHGAMPGWQVRLALSGAQLKSLVYNRGVVEDPIY